jgi:hypothetical protein
LQAIRSSFATPEDIRVTEVSLIKSLIIFLLLVTPLYTSGGEIYKWVDKHGKAHYGDRPQYDKSGNREVLSNAEREKAVANLKRAIDKRCR